MTVKVEEKCHDGRLDLIRIFHDVTEIKEIVSHTGSYNEREVTEFYCYNYELWSNDKKLGLFSKNDNTKISFQFNVTEQLQ